MIEVVARYADVAGTPDILDVSPDGSLVDVSARGPSPRSGAIHAAGCDTPGVAVVDAATVDQRGAHARITSASSIMMPRARNGAGQVARA